jgi:putative ABC transport system ATP-binding protein
MNDSRAIPSSAPMLRCDNLVHVYESSGSRVAALRGIDLVVEHGETVALLGPSGSGKSTLLWHFAGLLAPTAGTVELNGRNLASMSLRELDTVRVRDIGVMLQNGSRNLVPYISATENLMFAQRPTGRTTKGKQTRAGFLLEAVGLQRAMRRPAGGLSGGEQQRLALAVALVNGPELLLADEPTSQLDEVTAASIVELIKTANTEFGTAVVVVTHDAKVSVALGRTITIRDGRIGEESHEGESYLVVGKDGAMHLPPELLEALPPGSLARATVVDDGVRLQRVERARPDSDTGGGT